jgi:hypothetical protein
LLFLAVVETLLAGVLVLVLWRVGMGFVLGEYAGAPMLLSAATLVTALLLLGHMGANLFFPTLRHRFQAALARRAEATVTAAWQDTQRVLREHVEAVDRLAEEGHELLRAIDHIIQLHAQSAQDGRAVQALFGDEAAPVAAPVPLPEHRQGPRFE